MGAPLHEAPTPRRAFDSWEVVRACPACEVIGRGRRLVHFRAQTRCTACGHVYLCPRPTQKAIAYAYNRPEAYAQWLRDDKTRALMWDKRVSRLQRFAARGRLLDVGAGTGAFLDRLSRGGSWQVDGTEISTQATELASRHYGITLRQGQLGSLDLPESHYDVVTLWHVLEHVPDVGSTLRDVSRVLRPGGLAVIAVPNDSLLLRLPLAAARDTCCPSSRTSRSNVRLMLGAPSPGDEIHLHHFSPRTLKRAVGRARLRVQYVGIDDHYPRPSWKTDAKIRVGTALVRIAGVNLSPTIFLVARG
jgi:2-polyprenyl-3-methyl-5-hydroxy-6-metoxy-1,4-benzoquinol methylase